MRFRRHQFSRVLVIARTLVVSAGVVPSARRAAALFALLTFFVVTTQAQSSANTIDVAKLVRSAQVNGEAMSKRVFDYSWKSKTLVRNYKRARLLKEVEQDHEVYPAPGLTYVAQKLVRENGLPLSPKRAAKEEKRFTQELTEAELEQAIFNTGLAAGENKTGCPTFGIWTVLNGPGGKETSLGISDFLCFATFSAPRIERREGRDVAILLFRPRASDAGPPKEKTPFAKLVGAVWIDLQDKVVSHIEAWPAENPRVFPTSPTAAAAAIVFDDMRLADGMWVRRSRYIDTRKDPLAFNGLTLEWKQEFTGYQRYITESKDFTVEKPKEPDNQKP